MLTYAFLILAAGGAFTALCYCAASGFRNGDRPGDALVSALLTTERGPDEARPLIVVTVCNPSDSPVFAALTARAALVPASLAMPHAIGVPRWTARGKFRPGRYATVGVVPAGGTSGLAVPVRERARRYVLTAVVGQGDGRLRVHRLRLGQVARRAQGRDELPSPAPPLR